MEFEQKRDEPSKGDDHIVTTAPRTKKGYNKINKVTTNNQYKRNTIPYKVYFTAGYYIIFHLLVLYCVIISTYVIIVNNKQSSNNPSNLSSSSTEVNSTSSMPMKSPSYKPTVRPTVMPTYGYELYRNHIGDYKISAHNQSHGAWLLCNGQFVDSEDYPELFEIISHSFGSFPGHPSLFSLPDAKDRVIGVVGTKYKIGSIIGEEHMILTENHIPSHRHNLTVNGGCTNQNPLSVSQPYLAGSCYVNSNWESFSYGLKTTTVQPNAYPS
eukprot:2626_1